MTARTDFGKYGSACAKLRNLKVLIQGGVSRRAGTRFVREVKDSTALTRILEFEQSDEQAYIIESGNNYFRFLKDQGTVSANDVTASITNGTFDSDISSWTDESGAGSSIAHNSTDNRMSLISNGTTNAHAEQQVTNALAVDHNISFEIAATANPDHIVKLRIGTATNGTQIVNDVPFGVGFHTFTFTATAADFFVQFLHDFAGTIDIDDVLIIDNAPIEIETPYLTAQLFALRTAQNDNTMYIFHGSHPVYKLSRSNDSSWSLTRVPWNDGPYLDQNTTTTTLTAAATTGNGIDVTASSVTGINDGQGFLSTDVGRTIRITHTTNEPGWAIIESITSTTVVVVNIIRDFNATTATALWSLGAWSDTTGFPKTGNFFEQRLYSANTTTQSQTLWGSQAADIENQRPDSFVSSAVVVEDDDALIYTLAATKANVIRWLTAERQLGVGTSGGPWIAESAGVTLTPNDIQCRKRTQGGAADLEPIVADDAVLYIQKAKRKLNEFAFFDDTQGYQTNDMNILSDHILKGGVVEMTYQEEPGSLIHVIRSDGVIAPMAYRRSERVVGWGQYIIGGTFNTGDAVVESVSSIPGKASTNSEERNEVWIIVKRTIGGATKRYIEFFEGDFRGPLREDFTDNDEFEKAVIEAQKDAFYVDSGLTLDSPVIITNTTAADPVVVTTSVAHGFSDGDEVETAEIVGMTELNGLSTLIANKTATTFELVDQSTNKQITGATQADPVVITSTAHGHVNGDLIAIFEVNGMVDLNDIIYKVANKTNDTLELQTPAGVDIDGTSFTAYTDSGKIFNSLDGTSFTAYASDGVVRKKILTVTGLDHLDGEVVSILADGATHPDKTVSSGSITLEFSAGRVHVGEGYSHKYKSLKMTSGAAAGTAVGKVKRINDIVFVLLDSAAFKFGPNEDSLTDVTFRSSNDATDTPVPLFTGEVNGGFDGDFERDTRILAEGDIPLPWTMLAMAPEMSTNDPP